MKTALNTVIILLIVAIWSDIEKNSQKENLDYSTTLFCIGLLIIFSTIRLYYNQFTEFLKTPK
jgi:Ca2+/Na+ antiporter